MKLWINYEKQTENSQIVKIKHANKQPMGQRRNQCRNQKKKKKNTMRQMIMEIQYTKI